MKTGDRVKVTRIRTEVYEGFFYGPESELAISGGVSSAGNSFVDTGEYIMRLREGTQTYLGGYAGKYTEEDFIEALQ